MRLKTETASERVYEEAPSSPQPWQRLKIYCWGEALTREVPDPETLDMARLCRGGT